MICSMLVLFSLLTVLSINKNDCQDIAVCFIHSYSNRLFYIESLQKYMKSKNSQTVHNKLTNLDYWETSERNVYSLLARTLYKYCLNTLRTSKVVKPRVVVFHEG